MVLHGGGSEEVTAPVKCRYASKLKAFDLCFGSDAVLRNQERVRRVVVASRRNRQCFGWHEGPLETGKHLREVSKTCVVRVCVPFYRLCVSRSQRSDV